jgi:small subunit ribosomal protein S21
MAVNYSIKVRPRDNIDRVIKRFIKRTKKLGIIDEVKERQRYTKPSDKKRMAKKQAIRRRKKNEAKQRK